MSDQCGRGIASGNDPSTAGKSSRVVFACCCLFSLFKTQDTQNARQVAVQRRICIYIYIYIYIEREIVYYKYISYTYVCVYIYIYIIDSIP